MIVEILDPIPEKAEYVVNHRLKEYTYIEYSNNIAIGRYIIRNNGSIYHSTADMKHVFILSELKMYYHIRELTEEEIQELKVEAL